MKAGYGNDRQKLISERAEGVVSGGTVTLKLDEIDWQILRLLQRDARTANTSLAEHINLSPSACLARVRRLERNGAIQSYRAMINWGLLGASLDAWAELSVGDGKADEFKSFLVQTPQIVSAQRLASPQVFLIHFVGTSASAWRDFLGEAACAGFLLDVLRFNIAIECVKAPGATDARHLRGLA